MTKDPRIRRNSRTTRSRAAAGEVASSGPRATPGEFESAELLAQLKRAADSRDRAIAIVSHDLRTPLSTLQMCAAALLDPNPPPLDGIRHMAQIIHRSASWMQQIIQDLLDSAALDAGRLVLERQPCSVLEVCEGAHQAVAPLATESGVELRIAMADKRFRVDADPQRLLQILVNLLGHAVRSTSESGRVVLGVERMDGASGPVVRFAVTDTGPGISLGDSHARADGLDAERAGSRSHGLGMAIARGLVAAHHRELHVERGLQGGATLWFDVPETV